MKYSKLNKNNYEVIRDDGNTMRIAVLNNLSNYNINNILIIDNELWLITGCGGSYVNTLDLTKIEEKEFTEEITLILKESEYNKIKRNDERIEDTILSIIEKFVPETKTNKISEKEFEEKLEDIKIARVKKVLNTKLIKERVKELKISLRYIGFEIGVLPTTFIDNVHNKLKKGISLTDTQLYQMANILNLTFDEMVIDKIEEI